MDTNGLAEFHRKSVFRRAAMSCEELKEYYRRCRLADFTAGRPIKGITWRKAIHGVVVKVVQLDRLRKRCRLVVLEDARVPSSAPVIFACTHIGGDDIQHTGEALKGSSFYMFMGDPEMVYKSLDGLLCYFNGWICIDTGDKTDRHIGKARAEELLRAGGNLLIYPEGAWNLTENLPVMPLYTGTAEMALQTGSEIIPMAMEEYGRTTYVCIGQNICPSTLGFTEKKALTEYLRDQMATLKWHIWEQAPEAHHTLGRIEDQKNFEQHIINLNWFDYSMEDVERTRFHDRNVTPPEEAFTFLKNLKPCKENAFLLRNRCI